MHTSVDSVRNWISKHEPLFQLCITVCSWMIHFTLGVIPLNGKMRAVDYLGMVFIIWDPTVIELTFDSPLESILCACLSYIHHLPPAFSPSPHQLYWSCWWIGTQTLFWFHPLFSWFYPFPSSHLWFGGKQRRTKQRRDKMAVSTSYQSL